MRHPQANPYLDQLRQLVLQYVKGHKVKIYLFGSRAKGTERRRSDIDIALLPLETLPLNFFSNLREKISESTIPYSVDIVDLSTVGQEFRKKILSEAIEWKD